MPRKKVLKNDSAAVVRPKIQNAGCYDQSGNWGAMNQILGFGMPPFGIGTALNQLDTLFKNCRFYFISNMRQQLSEIYIEHGIIQRVVNIPVCDAFNGGIEIKSKQLDPDEIEVVQTAMEDNDDLTVLMHGHFWNRLFGGAGIVPITGEDPAKPFDINEVKEGYKLEFQDKDLWELFWEQQNTEGVNQASAFNEPMNYEYYMIGGVKFHRSRVMTLKGLKAPSFMRPRFRGWGVSIVEALVNSINQYLKANNLSYEVLDEFKVDYFKIKNFNSDLLNVAGQTQLQKRLAIANQQKNYQNAMCMDAEDDFIQKQLSWTGLAETWREIKMQMACDVNMPMSKIFGIPATGFSSGEDDLENYHQMVESSVRSPAKRSVLTIVKLRCQQTLGYVPDDLRIGFKPLRVLGAEAEENCKTQKFNRVLQAKTAGEISQDEFRDACNKDNLLPIQLEKGVVLPKLETEGGAKGAPAGKSSKSVTQAPEAKS